MDPIAHTLAGAALAQTGLRRLTPLATATLIIAANLPDIDGLMSFFGSDAALAHRRGVTHGILAQLLLPPLLGAGILIYDRLLRRRWHGGVPVRPGMVLLLAYIGLLSHPFLDWLNTYGVRLLMPFSDRWFYGDTLFIVDAWMWLLMAASVVLGYEPARWKHWLWLSFGLATSWLVATTALVPLPSKVLWWIGVGLIIGFRWQGISPDSNRKVAVGCLTAFALYLGMLAAGNHLARTRVEDWMIARHGQVPKDLMTGPVPANPFYREVVVVTATHYHGLHVPLLPNEAITERYAPVPLPQPNPIIQRALTNTEIQGFVHWMRYPVYELQKVTHGYRVIIRDLRYARPDQTSRGSFGMVETFVNEVNDEH